MPSAVKRITKELQRLHENKGEGADLLDGGPVADDKLQEWAVHLKGFEDDNASARSKELGKQLREAGLDGVEFRVVFPHDYPTEPPFVYARKPRISGAHIFGGGAMCMDVLMPHGWTPATTVSSLMRTIRSCFEETIALSPDWKNSKGKVVENQEDAARKTFSWVKTAHSNWSQATPQLSSAAALGKRARE